jgi:hypothetical protein
MISAKIVANSLNTDTDDQLTSFYCIYPRMIHSEVMTHCMLSRNAASSRAIPVEKMIRMIRENPAMPVEWGTMQKGMQAGPPLTGLEQTVAEGIWLSGLDAAIETANRLLALGVHKQITNRVLEPWAHMATLISATEWGNFFRLRAHPMAMPEFQELAFDMLRAYLDSTPREVNPYTDIGVDAWHLPYKARTDDVLTLNEMLKVSTARCARTSYLNFDGVFDIDADFGIHDKLLTSGHFSPFEHSACAVRDTEAAYAPVRGKFRGWRQYREMVEPFGQNAKPSREELEEIYSRRPIRG